VGRRNPARVDLGRPVGAAASLTGGRQAGWLGTAVTLGMLVHALGDAVTESGAPLLWPLPIRRRRWYPVGGPRPLRWRTGGPWRPGWWRPR
jgi:membrane-bound metal-dependent hydrolase YbcI (DUF457 family)